MAPDISARFATFGDLDDLVALYRRFEKEQVGLKRIWSSADGVAEPLEPGLKSMLDDPDALFVVGEIDGCAFGFAYARSEPLLPQGGDERIVTIYYIFTEPEARGVGVGEAMITLLLDELRERGHRRFDAHVLPGHRDAKNFFESNGFSARKIVMHHDPDK